MVARTGRDPGQYRERSVGLTCKDPGTIRCFAGEEFSRLGWVDRCDLPAPSLRWTAAAFGVYARYPGSGAFRVG